jgi:hypothetical protein
MYQLVLAHTRIASLADVFRRNTFLSFNIANRFKLNHFTYRTEQRSSFYPSFSESLIFKLQFTVVTSRSTTYLLLLFWLAFFHFGETLLLIVFNYSVTVDSINSSSFMLIKQHVPYALNSVSAKLLSQVNFFIFLLTPLAFTYLLCLGYSGKYKFFQYSSISNCILLIAAGISLFTILY